MTIIQAFTVKHMSDIGILEDTIDKEYMNRMLILQTKDELIRILDDYREFLPEGVQKFRECNELEFRELLFQIRRIYNMAIKKGQMPAEPTEAVVFVSPPILSRIRASAIILQRMTGKYHTWGMAFEDFKSTGKLQDLLENQEKLYNHIIKIKPKFQELMDKMTEETH